MFSAMLVPNPAWKELIAISTSCTITVDRRKSSIASPATSFPKREGKKTAPNVQQSKRLMKTANITGINWRSDSFKMSAKFTAFGGEHDSFERLEYE
jgi:hypothetical protein